MEVDDVLLARSVRRMEKIAPLYLKQHGTHSGRHRLIVSERPWPAQSSKYGVIKPLWKPDNETGDAGLGIGDQCRA